MKIKVSLIYTFFAFFIICNDGRAHVQNQCWWLFSSSVPYASGLFEEFQLPAGFKDRELAVSAIQLRWEHAQQQNDIVPMNLPFEGNQLKRHVGNLAQVHMGARVVQAQRGIFDPDFVAVVLDPGQFAISFELIVFYASTRQLIEIVTVPKDAIFSEQFQMPHIKSSQLNPQTGIMDLQLVDRHHLIVGRIKPRLYDPLKNVGEQIVGVSRSFQSIKADEPYLVYWFETVRFALSPTVDQTVVSSPLIFDTKWSNPQIVHFKDSADRLKTLMFTNESWHLFDSHTQTLDMASFQRIYPKNRSEFSVRLGIFVPEAKSILYIEESKQPPQTEPRQVRIIFDGLDASQLPTIFEQLLPPSTYIERIELAAIEPTRGHMSVRMMLSNGKWIFKDVP